MADYPVVTAERYSKVAPPPKHFEDIDELREKYRYFWNDHAQGYWVLTRFADIREAFQDPEVFSNHSIVKVRRSSPMPGRSPSFPFPWCGTSGPQPELPRPGSLPTGLCRPESSAGTPLSP
jgi:cytochrome P450